MRRLPIGYSPTFSEMYNDSASFLLDYGVQFPDNLKPSTPALIYNLLLAKYATRRFAIYNPDQIKLRLFSIIWQYGPSWEKELDIQAQLRALSQADLRTGAKAIHNHALNPATSPSTGALTELDKIDEQNTTTYVKSPIEGYAQLIELLENDVTEAFLKRFEQLFTKFSYDLTNQYFIAPEEEEEDEE